MVNAIGIFAEPNTNRVLTNKVAFYGSPRVFRPFRRVTPLPATRSGIGFLPVVNHTTVPLWETRFGEPAMAITDIPILSMLRTRLEWAQSRQRVLAENVANSDTPKFHTRDLAPLQFDDTPLSTAGIRRGAISKASA